MINLPSVICSNSQQINKYFKVMTLIIAKIVRWNMSNKVPFLHRKTIKHLSRNKRGIQQTVC